MESVTTRRIAWLLTLALGVVLVVRALEVRLPGMTRPIWQDEIHHNEPILESSTMAELDRDTMYWSMMQPKLDFWMRKTVWFPTLGISERSIRIPALVFGIALVLLVYVVLLLFFRSRLQPIWLAVFAFCAALWIVDNPMEIQYAVEARHYSLVALASTAWFAALLLFEGKPRLVLSATSILFANTHFFALPLIAAGYGLQILRELRLRKYFWIALHLLTCWCVYECTVRLNGASFGPLVARPPAGRGTSAFAIAPMFNAVTVKAALTLWLQLSQALAVPPVTWLAWLLILVGVVVRRHVRWLPALLAAFVVFPVMFAYMQSRSSYPWGDRYFSAFFGFGLVTLVAGFDIVLREWKLRSAALSDRRRLIAVMSGAVALALLFGLPSALYRSLSQIRNLRRVPANFSPYYLAYHEIWAERKPVLTLHQWLFTTDIQRFYFRHLLPPNGVTYRQFDLFGRDIDLSVLKKSGIPWFLTAFVSEGAFVVLDEKERDCGNRSVPPIPPPMRVERVQSVTACLWKVRGATTLAQLAQAAELVGFGGAARLR